VHIPYNGGAPAQAALLGGPGRFQLRQPGHGGRQHPIGPLKALAVTTAQRTQVMPDVPTVAETLPGFEIDTWWGLVVPAGTPADRVGQLNAAFTQALNAPAVRERFATLMAEPAPSTPQAFGDFMNRERAKYERVVKLSGAKVD
jgi:tripartite-type tricarboxylate transporter receptor subunit TctC